MLVANVGATWETHFMQTSELLTAKEKAEELGISRATLTRRVQAGKIVPAYRGAGDNGVTLFTPEPH